MQRKGQREGKRDRGLFESTSLSAGFGDNSRVVDWVLRRCDELFSIPKDFWMQEADCIHKYFEEEVGEDLPNEMWDELSKLRRNIEQA